MTGNFLAKNQRKRVFVDMDGVLCEYRLEATLENFKEKGYFASLLPRQETIDAIKNVISNENYEVFVLSAVIAECKDQSIEEKNEWLDKYLPEIDKNHRIFTLCGGKKTDAIKNFNKNDILIDDYSKNLTDWVSAGGKAIKVLNEFNGQNNTFTKGPRLKVENTSAFFHTLAVI